MIIPRYISDRILTISTSRKGKGGVAAIVNTLSDYYETFNYIASTRSKNPLVMCSYFGGCIVSLLYYILWKKIEIVHIHGASRGSFVRKMILINLCMLLNVKIIYHMHGGGFKEFYSKYNKRNLIKRTLNKADVLIVLSTSWERYYSSIVDKHRIRILNNMIPNPSYSKEYVCNHVVHFLFLGQLSDGKGIFDLVDVLKEMKVEYESKLILHIGGNGETERLKEQIYKYSLDKMVIFEGWVSGDKKRDLLSTCDVYILPSYMEGLPISILEAMSYGMPIISTNVGGIPEIVESGKNGFLIEAGDKKALRESLEFYVNSQNEIKKMGQNSLLKIAKFYPEKVIPQLECIYKELLSNG